MRHSIRLLLVEDHLVMRAALRLLLNHQPRLLVVGEAGSCHEAVTLVRQENPEVVLLDLWLGEASSLDCIPQLLGAVPPIRILVLTSVLDLSLHRQAMRQGAHGVVRKEQPAEVLLEAIQAVAAGREWIEPDLAASLKGETLAPEWESIEQLTAREREVIALIGGGLRNKEIARRLEISERTVHNHLASIFHKLKVHNRLELIVFARQYNLLP